jgi:hypothetical protein
MKKLIDILDFIGLGILLCLSIVTLILILYYGG